MNIFIRNMEANESVKRYELNCKLTQENEKDAKEINTFFKEFKEQYRNADTKKEFFRVNNIKDNDGILFNLKLILDMFNWQEITVETINKVAKLHKKKPEHLLNTICKRIENYRR